MDKKLITLILFVLLSFSVLSVNYDFFYNPYTANMDRSVNLNQSGDNLTADYFFGNGSYLVGINVLDTNETERVNALELANVSTNTRIDDLNESYNTTTLLKDDDNYLSVNQPWLDGLYFSIVNLEIFNTSLYSIFYEQTVIEAMNSTLWTNITNLESGFIDTNETKRVNALELANVSTNIRITNLNASYNTTTIEKDDNNFWTVKLSWLLSLFYQKSEVYSNTEIEGMNTTLINEDSAINSELDELESNFTAQNNTNYLEFVEVGDTAGGDLSGTYPNPTVNDDSHLLSCSNITGSASDLCTIVDTDTHISGTEIVEEVGNWSADKVSYYTNTIVESMNSTLWTNITVLEGDVDTNETERVNALELANVSTNVRVDDLNSTKISTTEEGNLNVNSSTYWADTNGYNSTEFEEDGDGYLHIVWSWITGLFYQKSETYSSTEIEGMNTTLGEGITSNTNWLSGLESNFTNENVTLWTNISNLENNPVIDTNETTRFNSLVGTDCGGTDKAVGIDNDGTISCSADINTDCSISENCATVYQGTNAVLDAGTSWTGDLGGTGSSPSVDDDSHNHIGTNIDAGAFNSGSYSFPDDVTIETIKMENDATNHQITDNSTCTIIKGDTSTLSIC